MGRPDASWEEGDARWPSLPPTMATIAASPMVPTAASRRQRRAAAAQRRGATKIAAALAVSAATLAASADLLAARSSGGRREVSGTPGAGGDASPSTLTPQAQPGAGSWADLMDADDAAAERAAGLGAAALWSSQRAAYCVDIVGNAVHMPLGGPGAGLPPHLEAVYTAMAQVGAVEGRNVLGHSGGFGPSVSGAPRAQMATDEGSNLTPCSGPSFPPAPRLGAIHKSKCGLPPNPPLTQQATPSSGASAGGARFEGSGGNSEVAPVPPWSSRGGSTSSGVQTTRSGGSDNTSNGVQTTRSGGSGNAGSDVQTTRSGGSGNTGRDVQTTRSGDSGGTNSGVQTTRSGEAVSTSNGAQTTRSGEGGSAGGDVQTTRSGKAGSTSNGAQTTRSGGGGSTGGDVQTTRSGGGGSTGSGVQATRSGGSGSDGGGVRTTRCGGNGSDSSAVQTTRSGGGGNIGSDVQTTRSGGRGSTSGDMRASGLATPVALAMAPMAEEAMVSRPSGPVEAVAPTILPRPPLLEAEAAPHRRCPLGGEGGMQKPPDPTPEFGVLQDEEGCTRRCIQELQAAVLELLLHGFWEQGLHCTAPLSSIGLCANPPPGRLPCVAPWGTAPVCRREEWGSTPPLHCPDNCPLPPRPHGNRRALPLQPPVLPMLRGWCAACGPCRPPNHCSAQWRSAARVRGPCAEEALRTASLPLPWPNPGAGKGRVLGGGGAWVPLPPLPPHIDGRGRSRPPQHGAPTEGRPQRDKGRWGTTITHSPRRVRVVPPYSERGRRRWRRASACSRPRRGME